MRSAPSRQFVEAAMQRIIVSTDDVPEAERYAYWREAVIEPLFAASAECDKDEDTPFAGRLVVSASKSVTRVRARGDGHPVVVRRPRDLGRRRGDVQITLHRASAPVAWSRPDGRD
jgi:hypothetical protein